MLGVTSNTQGVPHFTLNNLHQDPSLGEAENKRRRNAVHALYGWESVERMEIEFHVSVEPFYHLLPHHGRVHVKQLIELLLERLEGALQTGNATRASLLSPIDVFGLPFRHVTANETIEVLALNLGLGCDHLG